MDGAELAKEKELLKSRNKEKSQFPLCSPPLVMEALGIRIQETGLGFVCVGRQVDRRASKGRKIRYKPIPQLENFVVSGRLERRRRRTASSLRCKL